MPGVWAGTPPLGTSPSAGARPLPGQGVTPDRSPGVEIIASGAVVQYFRIDSRSSKARPSIPHTDSIRTCPGIELITAEFNSPIPCVQPAKIMTISVNSFSRFFISRPLCFGEHTLALADVQVGGLDRAERPAAHGLVIGELVLAPGAKPGREIDRGHGHEPPERGQVGATVGTEGSLTDGFNETENGEAIRAVESHGFPLVTVPRCFGRPVNRRGVKPCRENHTKDHREREQSGS